jgi:hypothetical protein
MHTHTHTHTHTDTHKHTYTRTHTHTHTGLLFSTVVETPVINYDKVRTHTC